MKKWGILFVLLLLCGCEWPGQDPDISLDVQTTAEASATANDLQIKVSKDQIYKGNLALVNKTYPIHTGSVPVDIVNIFQHKELVKGFALLDNTIRLPRSLIQSFTTMVAAASVDGVKHFSISSGYRDNAEQSKLFKDMGPEVALPAGHSEHNLGLSLDIGSTLTEMNQAPEGKWLKQNAWRYGFILRYPPNKTDITGIQFEPWHFRYVGLPHSAIMQDHNFTLEEYLDYLKVQKSLKVNVEGKKYEILYVPSMQLSNIKVPSNHRYELSGNNMDGVIVTVQL